MNAIPPIVKLRRRKWFWRVLWTTLALVVGLTSLWCIGYLRASWEREGLFAELRAKGEPVFWSELVGKLSSERASRSDSDPFREAVQSFMNVYVSNGPTALDPDSLMSLEVELKKSHPEPSVHPQVSKEVNAAAPLFRLFGESLGKPPKLVTTDLKSDDPTILIPLVQYGRPFEKLLFWDTYDAIACCDADRAFRAVELRFAYADGLAADPFIASQLNRISPYFSRIEQLEVCLAYAKPGEASFRRLDALLSKWDDGFNLQPALSSERASYLSVLESRATMMREFKGWQDWWAPRQGWTPSMESTWVEILASPVGRPTVMREQSAYIRLIDEVSKIIDRPDASWNEGEKAIDAFIAGSPFRKEAMDRPVHQMTSGLALLGRIAPNSHRKLILARIALRLRHYYDMHGKFPPTLDEICDESMPKIRLDWFPNLPLIYQPRGDGFILDVSPDLRLEPGFYLKQNQTDKISTFGWDFKLKTIKQGAAK